MLSPSSEAFRMGHCCEGDATGGGTNEERHESEADAVVLLRKRFSVSRRSNYDASEIHFIHAVDVSAGTPLYLIMRWAMILRMFVMGTRSPG